MHLVGSSTHYFIFYKSSAFLEDLMAAQVVNSSPFMESHCSLHVHAASILPIYLHFYIFLILFSSYVHTWVSTPGILKRRTPETRDFIFPQWYKLTITRGSKWLCVKRAWKFRCQKPLKTLTYNN